MRQPYKEERNKYFKLSKEKQLKFNNFQVNNLRMRKKKIEVELFALRENIIQNTEISFEEPAIVQPKRNPIKLTYHKIKQPYKNTHKTLTEGFVHKFGEKMQNSLDSRRLKDQMQLYKNSQQRKHNFMSSFSGLLDQIDSLQIGDNTNTSYHNYTLNTNNNIFLTNKVSPNQKRRNISYNFSKNNTSETHYTTVKCVTLNFPREARPEYQNKITNLTRSLNKELGRISNTYGKVEAYKKFSDNPFTRTIFNSQDYLAYRTSKLKEINRPKLKPLKIIKDNALDLMTHRIFNMTNRNIREYK